MMQPNQVSENFLTAGVDGLAYYKGDTVYSTFHERFVVLTGVYADYEGDVYLFCAGGSLSIRSAQRLTANQLIPENLKKLLDEVEKRSFYGQCDR